MMMILSRIRSRCTRKKSDQQLPPVSMVKEDISEFYATTTDIFHVHHLYFNVKEFQTPPIIPQFTGGDRGVKVAEGLIKCIGISIFRNSPLKRGD